MEIQIIEDFLPIKYQQDIINTVCYDPGFPWYKYHSTYNHNTVVADNVDPQILKQEGVVPTNKTKESPQFVHSFYNESNGSRSDWFAFMRTMNYFIPHNINNILRIKVNCMQKQPDYPEGFYNTIHTDTNRELPYAKDMKTLLYYPMDTDGDTYFFNKTIFDDDKSDIEIMKTVSPKSNRAVIFDSAQLHASSPPRISEWRFAVNFIFT